MLSFGKEFLPNKNRLALPHLIWDTAKSQVLRTLKEKAFQFIVGIRETADNQDFLIFPQCFLPCLGQESPFKSYILFVVCNSLNLVELRIFLVWHGIKTLICGILME